MDILLVEFISILKKSKKGIILLNRRYNCKAANDPSFKFTKGKVNDYFKKKCMNDNTLPKFMFIQSGFLLNIRYKLIDLNKRGLCTTKVDLDSLSNIVFEKSLVQNRKKFSHYTAAGRYKPFVGQHTVHLNNQLLTRNTSLGRDGEITFGEMLSKNSCAVKLVDCSLINTTNTPFYMFKFACYPTFSEINPTKSSSTNLPTMHDNNILSHPFYLPINSGLEPQFELIQQLPLDNVKSKDKNAVLQPTAEDSTVYHSHLVPEIDYLLIKLYGQKLLLNIKKITRKLEPLHRLPVRSTGEPINKYLNLLQDTHSQVENIFKDEKPTSEMPGIKGDLPPPQGHSAPVPSILHIINSIDRSEVIIRKDLYITNKIMEKIKKKQDKVDVVDEKKLISNDKPGTKKFYHFSTCAERPSTTQGKFKVEPEAPFNIKLKPSTKRANTSDGHIRVNLDKKNNFVYSKQQDGMNYDKRAPYPPTLIDNVACNLSNPIPTVSLVRTHLRNAHSKNNDAGYGNGNDSTTNGGGSRQYTVDVSTETCITMAKSGDQAKVQIREVQKFKDKRLPLTFTTDNLIQFQGSKERLRESTEIVEVAKTKLVLTNSKADDGVKSNVDHTVKLAELLSFLKHNLLSNVNERKVKKVPVKIESLPDSSQNIAAPKQHHNRHYAYNIESFNKTGMKYPAQRGRRGKREGSYLYVNRDRNENMNEPTASIVKMNVRSNKELEVVKLSPKDIDHLIDPSHKSGKNAKNRGPYQEKQITVHDNSKETVQKIVNVKSKVEKVSIKNYSKNSEDSGNSPTNPNPPKPKKTISSKKDKEKINKKTAEASPPSKPTATKKSLTKNLEDINVQRGAVTYDIIRIPGDRGDKKKNVEDSTKKKTTSNLNELFTEDDYSSAPAEGSVKKEEQQLRSITNKSKRVIQSDNIVISKKLSKPRSTILSDKPRSDQNIETSPVDNLKKVKPNPDKKDIKDPAPPAKSFKSVEKDRKIMESPQTRKQKQQPQDQRQNAMSKGAATTNEAESAVKSAATKKATGDVTKKQHHKPTLEQVSFQLQKKTNQNFVTFSVATLNKSNSKGTDMNVVKVADKGKKKTQFEGAGSTEGKPPTGPKQTHQPKTDKTIKVSQKKNEKKVTSEKELDQPKSNSRDKREELVMKSFKIFESKLNNKKKLETPQTQKQQKEQPQQVQQQKQDEATSQKKQQKKRPHELQEELKKTLPQNKIKQKRVKDNKGKDESVVEATTPYNFQKTSNSISHLQSELFNVQANYAKHCLDIIDLVKESKEMVPPSSALLSGDIKRHVLTSDRLLKFPLLNKLRNGYEVKKHDDEILSIDCKKDLVLRRQVKTLPSVTKVLNSTLSESSRAALSRWRKKLISELGDKGFQDFYKAQLDNGIDFHDKVCKHFSGKRQDLVRSDNLALRSISHISELVNEVSVLESLVMHPNLSYRGIIDCVAKYKGKPVLIEWKRCSKKKNLIQNTFDAPLQLSAYIGALNYDNKYNIQVDSGLIVIAYNDGSPADLFLIPNQECEKYWKLWLIRLKQFSQLQNAPTPSQSTLSSDL